MRSKAPAICSGVASGALINTSINCPLSSLSLLDGVDTAEGRDSQTLKRVQFLFQQKKNFLRFLRKSNSTFLEGSFWQGQSACLKKALENYWLHHRTGRWWQNCVFKCLTNTFVLAIMVSKRFWWPGTGWYIWIKIVFSSLLIMSDKHKLAAPLTNTNSLMVDSRKFTLPVKL